MMVTKKKNRVILLHLKTNFNNMMMMTYWNFLKISFSSVCFFFAKYFGCIGVKISVMILKFKELSSIYVKG